MTTKSVIKVNNQNRNVDYIEMLVYKITRISGTYRPLKILVPAEPYGLLKILAPAESLLALLTRMFALLTRKFASLTYIS